MMSIEDRYRIDPLIKAFVDYLENQIHTLALTPTEIRECAMLAAIRYDRRKFREYSMIVNPVASRGEGQA